MIKVESLTKYVLAYVFGALLMGFVWFYLVLHVLLAIPPCALVEPFAAYLVLLFGLLVGHRFCSRIKQPRSQGSVLGLIAALFILSCIAAIVFFADRLGYTDTTFTRNGYITIGFAMIPICAFGIWAGRSFHGK
jgi:hypothetical protein